MADRFSVIAPAVSDEMRYEPRPQRVRASREGHPVADTADAWLVWEPRRVVPRYALPASDVVADLEPGDRTEPDLSQLPPLVPPNVATHTAPGTELTILVGGERVSGAAYRPADPDLADRIVVDFAPFTWHEEDQEVIGHPRDPFKRIDCLPTSRHVTFALDGVTLADSTRPMLLLETHLPPRWYVPREDVRFDQLTPSDTTSICAYKGVASYFSHAPAGDAGADIAWTYPEPMNDALPVTDHVCFYAERLDVTVDGVTQERPRTQWSRD